MDRFSHCSGGVSLPGSLCTRCSYTQSSCLEDFPSISFCLQHCSLAPVCLAPSLLSECPLTLRISLSPSPVNVSEGRPSLSALSYSLNITLISFSYSLNITFIYLLSIVYVPHVNVSSKKTRSFLLHSHSVSFCMVSDQ